MRVEGAAVQRIRMRFSKSGPVRFLSHLDLLKSIERSLRRAELPVSYSEGFHPMMRLSFGPALALGSGSSAEWMDVDMGVETPPEEVRQRLNETLPQGLEILEARDIPLRTPSLQAEIRRAVYRVRLEGPGPDLAGLDARVAALLAQQEIPLKKKNKTVNLRSFIEDLRVAECFDGGCFLEVTLRLGPEGAVRPDDVLSPLLEGSALKSRAVERTALLRPRGEAWGDPWPDPPVESSSAPDALEHRG